MGRRRIRLFKYKEKWGFGYNMQMKKNKTKYEHYQLLNDKKCIALYKKEKRKNYLTNEKVAKNHNGTIRFRVKLSQKRLVR